MAKKKKEILQEKTHTPSKKQLATISIILTFVIALGSIIFFLFLQSPDVKFSLNAAIIDQLGEEFPNPTFVKNVTTILETHGFNVTHHNKTLDVNFFKGLAKYNYGIIILRVHSALREDNSTVDLFTSEEFADYKHRPERENGLLVRGELLYAPGKLYFAITSKFIENLEGRFPKSIVIAMGCWSLKQGCEEMAMAFIEKGAKAYVGWTDIVLPRDTDYETVKLLKMLLNENRTLAYAVTRTKEYTYRGDNKTVYTQMIFYPQTAENLTISELIAEAKVSSALTALSNAKNLSSFLIANASENKRIFKSQLILCNVSKLLHKAGYAENHLINYFLEVF